MSIGSAPVAALAASVLLLSVGAADAALTLLSAQLTDGVTSSSITIGVPDNRPAAGLTPGVPFWNDWEDILDGSISSITTNPLYQGSGTGGTNPLHTSQLYVVSVPSVTLTYLHKDGIVHRDIAARMYFTPVGETTPLMIADVLFSLDDYALPGSTPTPDNSVLLGLWSGTQITPAALTFPDGSPTGETLSVIGATWSFNVVPSPGTAVVLGGVGLMGVGRRRR